MRGVSSGLALLPVVLAIGIVAAIAFLLNREAAMSGDLARRSAETSAATYVAEAGLQHELWRLEQADCSGYTPLPATGFGAHQYSASVSPASGTPVEIEATGQLAGGATVRLARELTVYAAAKTETLQPDSNSGQDSTLESGAAADANFGALAQMQVSNGGALEHALLRFDVSSLPQSAKIRSATLELELESVGFGGAGTAEVHALLQSYLEDEATWNEHRVGVPWTTPGGDYDPLVAAAAPIDGGLPGPVQWDVTALVLSWVRNASANDGVLLATGAGIEDATFTSSEGACAARPKLTVTYSCVCGQSCELADPPLPACPADYHPSHKIDEFSAMAFGADELWDLTYLPECVVFNGVPAPIGGAWLGVDIPDDELYMFDLAGNVLTSMDTKGLIGGLPSNDVIGVELVTSGTWKDHLALADWDDREVYFVDLAGNVQGSFPTGGFTDHPVGVTFIADSASGTLDDHLVISSDKDAGGGSSAALYIVDQSGALVQTIDVSGWAPEPWGVAHVPGTDTLLVADKTGVVVLVDIAVSSYDATVFGVTQPQGAAIHPRTGAHVFTEKDNKVVITLNRYRGYRDEFNAISYAGNDGTLTWTADWQETGEGDGPSLGLVRVRPDIRCVAGNCLRIGGDQVNINGRGVVREADLTSFGTATLHFSYVRNLTDDGNGGSVSVEVSPDGVAWTALQSYPLDATDGAPVPQSFDITPYRAATTQIRFRGSGNSVECYFYADDVWIEPEGCDSP